MKELKDVILEYKANLGLDDMTQFAAHLGVAPTTVYSWLNQNRKPFGALPKLLKVLPLEVYCQVLLSLRFLSDDIVLISSDELAQLQADLARTRHRAASLSRTPQS